MEFGFTSFTPPDNSHNNTTLNGNALPHRFTGGSKSCRLRQLGAQHPNHLSSFNRCTSVDNNISSDISTGSSLVNLHLQSAPQGQHAIDDLVSSGIPRHFATDWYNKLLAGDKIVLPVMSWSQSGASKSVEDPQKTASVTPPPVRDAVELQTMSFDDGSGDSDEGINFITSANSCRSSEYIANGKPIPFWLQNEPTLAEQLATIRCSERQQPSYDREISSCSTTTLDTVNESEDGGAEPALPAVQEEITCSSLTEDVSQSTQQLLRQSCVDIETVKQDLRNSARRHSSEVEEISSNTRQKLIPPKLVLNLVDDNDKIEKSKSLCDWLGVTSSSISNFSTPAISPVTVIEKCDDCNDPTSNQQPVTQFIYPSCSENKTPTKLSDEADREQNSLINLQESVADGSSITSESNHNNGSEPTLITDNVSSSSQQNTDNVSMEQKTLK